MTPEEIDRRVDDRLEALHRTLGDPGLSRELKVAELASVLARIDGLEADRLWSWEDVPA